MSWWFNFVLEIDLVGGPGFNTPPPPPPLLQFESSFDYLKVYEVLCLVCLTLNVREGVKRHEIRINLTVFTFKCITN